MLEDITSARPEQGTDEAHVGPGLDGSLRRHPSDALDARASNQSVQDRLDLVVSVVSDRNGLGADFARDGRKKRVALAPGDLLERAAAIRVGGVHVAAFDCERHARSCGEFTNEMFVLIRLRRAEAVVEVRCMKPNGYVTSLRHQCEQVQQADGVGTSG